MKSCNHILDIVSRQADSILLMHSAAGKDSIALLDMLSKRFKRVVCVFMYLVKDLAFIDKYIEYQERRYPNCVFIKVPHFVLLRMIRFGELGIKPNPDIRLLKLTDIVDEVCRKEGIDWACMGFKKSDSLNRRLMLNTYEMGGIHRGKQRCYPLTDWKNKDVLNYIKKNNLIRPIKYDNAQSSDVDPKNGAWLKWCKSKYPDEYRKILSQFPLAGAFLFEYEQKNADTQRV